MAASHSVRFSLFLSRASYHFSMQSLRFLLSSLVISSVVTAQATNQTTVDTPLGPEYDDEAALPLPITEAEFLTLVRPSKPPMDGRRDLTGPASRRLDVPSGDYTALEACGVDLQGGDLFSIKQRWGVDCALLCEGFVVDCLSMTWTDYQGGTCWFKRNGGSTRSDPKTKAYSYMYTEASSLPSYKAVYVSRDNCDFPGNDLSNARETDYRRCAARCIQDTRCWAFTWSNYQGGTCWFKTEAATCVKKPGVNSYFVWKAMLNPGYCAIAGTYTGK